MHKTRDKNKTMVGHFTNLNAHTVIMMMIMIKVMIESVQITSKLTELLDSQVPDSSHDFDPIKQVESDDQ